MSFDHWLHVYDRPVQSNAFRSRYKALHYRHTISAVGWYDTAQCDLVMPRSEAEKFIEDMVGCRAAAYLDNPAEPIWDGFINRITMNAGALMFTRSLDEMMNRVAVTYTAPEVATNPQNLAAADDLVSQAIYGIKSGSVEGKVIRGTNVTRITVLRDTFLAARAYPQNSTVLTQGGEAVLSVELKGWHDTLNWVRYVVGSTSGTSGRTATEFFTDLLPDYPNTDFFSVSDFSLIEDNTAWDGDRREISGRTLFQMWQSVQEIGDGDSRWIFGITPTDRYGVRRVYFRPINGAVEYIFRARDGRIRNLYGKPVPPWMVRPDRGIRVTDVLTGWQSSELDDPRAFYVDRVDYDADSQVATPIGPDDTTFEGAFQVRNFYELYGKRFSPKGRVTFS